jgi:AcrR family transcriptional regulator
MVREQTAACNLALRLVDEAIALFAARGFAATTVQSVIDACGCSKPALYHHYANKDDLYEAALSVAVERTGVEQGLLGSAERFEDALRSGLLHICEQARRYPNDFRLLLRATDEAAQEMSRLRTRTLAQLERQLLQAVNRGELRPALPVAAAAVNLVGTVRLSLQLWLDGGKGEECEQDTLSLFLHGVARQDSASGAKIT